MTEQEKARAYDEALKIAQCWLNAPQIIQECNYTIEDAIQSIFPQLKNSEDERIRKWIFDLINNMSFENLTASERAKNEEWKKKVLAYLEKQKYNRMKPIYGNQESFESALEKAWKEYNDSGSRTVDSCEDDYVECAHAKGFREGYLFGLKKQKEPHYTKRNELFDKCVENCDPEVMKEVSDSVDKMLEPSESEDERIRKYLIEELKAAKSVGELKFIIQQPTREECIAYLEKQKENPKSEDSIPSDCVSDAKCEDRWHKVKDSLPNSAREVLCKDAIGNFFIGRYYKSTQSWEVVMYDDCDKSNEDNPPVVEWCEIPSEKQKEQKPTNDKAFEEWIDGWWKEHKEKAYPQITMDEKEFKNFCRGIRNMYAEQKPVPISCSHENGIPAEWSEEDESTMNDLISLLWILQGSTNLREGTASEYTHWLKSIHERFSLQPKEEWSEEDEDFINMLILHFNYLIDKGGDSVETYKSYIKKLKSLRPSWKPSEEQMRVLKQVEDRVAMKSGYWEQVLDSLYTDLQKL